MAFGFSFKVVKKNKYEYKGLEYENPDELPEEARRTLGLPAKGGEDEDEELEDLSVGGRGEEPGKKTPPASRSVDSASKFYAGIIIFGLLYLWFGADLLWRALSGPRSYPAAAVLAVVFLVSGAGLLKRWNWARILVLVHAPLIALWSLKVIPRFKGFGVPLFIWVVLSTSALSFVYLLLPPVKAFFLAGRKPKSGLRLSDMPAPPRKLDRSLVLAVLFGNHFVLLSLFILALAFLPILNTLNRLVGGPGPGFSNLSGAGMILPAVFLAAAACGWALLAWTLRWGRLQLNQLRNWKLCHGTLVSKVRIRSGRTHIHRLKFEYEIDGKKYRNICDVPFTSRFEDEEKEPMLYDPAKPGRSMLVDELPADIVIGEGGELRPKNFLAGYFFASLPALLLLLMIFFAFRSF